MSLSKEKFPLTTVEGKNIIAAKTLATALKLVSKLERVIREPNQVMEYLDDDGKVVFRITWEDKEAFKRIATSEVAELSSDYVEEKVDGEMTIFINPPFPQLTELGRMNRVQNTTQAFVAHTLIEKYMETE